MPPAPPPAASGNGPSRSSLAQFPWLELAGFAAILAAIVVPLVFFGGQSHTPTGSESLPPSSSPIPRTTFQFESAKVRISSLGGARAFAASRAAGEAIRVSLSRFYDQAFVDPAAWSNGVPSAAWDLFSPSVRPQAERDATSLALGSQVSALSSLS